MTLFYDHVHIYELGLEPVAHSDPTIETGWEQIHEPEPTLRTPFHLSTTVEILHPDPLIGSGWEFVRDPGPTLRTPWYLSDQVLIQDIPDIAMGWEETHNLPEPTLRIPYFLDPSEELYYTVFSDQAQEPGWEQSTDPGHTYLIPFFVGRDDLGSETPTVQEVGTEQTYDWNPVLRVGYYLPVEDPVLPGIDPETEWLTWDDYPQGIAYYRVGYFESTTTAEGIYQGPPSTIGVAVLREILQGGILLVERPLL